MFSKYYFVIVWFSISLQSYYVENKVISCEDWENEVGGSCKSQNSTFIKCFGDFNTQVKWHRRIELENVEILLICGYPRRKMNPSTLLTGFNRINLLQIEYGNLTEFQGNFPRMNNLETVNITWTNLSELKPSVFSNVVNLKYLDLRYNSLNLFERPLELSKTFQKMHLTGNPWNCTYNLSWLVNERDESNVADKDELLCTDSAYSGRHLITVIFYLQKIKYECEGHEELRNCSCTMHYIHKSDDGKSLIPIYSVNCSYRHFHNFPSYLPSNTTIFYASGNQISDVRTLRNNEHYTNVVDIYLDNNNVTSIDVLEAGYWLRHFRVFNLNGNQLTKLPVYALDNALENNNNAISLYLGNNPWICECKFTMRLREIVMKYSKIIMDSNDVSCNYVDENEGNQTRKFKVLQIDRGDVCTIHVVESRFQSLDILNIILSILILFVFVKLAYDYYHYKNYGRLPWIVTKLP